MVLKSGMLTAVLLAMLCSGVKAQDVIYTMEGEKIKAEVEIISSRAVMYQQYQDPTDVKRRIARSNVYMIRYEEGKEEILVSGSRGEGQDKAAKTASADTPGKEVPMVDGKPITTLSKTEKCVRGRKDANRYHGKVGAHVLYGLIGGPIATIGAALSDPTPTDGRSTVTQSDNQALFDDPAYRSCYTKEARGNNVVGTLILPLLGTAVLLFTSG